MPGALPRNFVRRGGSGFTIFTFGGQPISFCQQVAHTSPRPVGAGASAIQPMDEPYPIEIITPAAAGMGQIVLNLFELFGSGGAASKAWDRLGVQLGTGASPFGGTSYTNESIYQSLIGNSTHAPFYGLVDIVDIFIAQAQLDPNAMQIVKVIRPNPLPTALGAQPAPVSPYTEEYVGCVITDVADNEQIEVGTLEIVKQLTISYRYMTRNGRTSQAFAKRDSSIKHVAST